MTCPRCNELEAAIAEKDKALKAAVCQPPCVCSRCDLIYDAIALTPASAGRRVEKLEKVYEAAKKLKREVGGRWVETEELEQSVSAVESETKNSLGLRSKGAESTERQGEK